MRVIYVLLMMTFSFVSFGQNDKGGGASKIGGLKAGWLSSGYSTGYGGDANFAGGKSGWYISYSKETRFAKILGLETELMYQLLGYSGGSNIKYNLNYMQIPLNLNIHLGPVYIGAGIYGSILLTAKSKIGDVKSKYSWDDYTWGDWGATFQAGLKFKRFSIDVRYQMGLQNFVNGGAGGLPGDTYYNQALMVGGGFYF